MLMEEGFSYTKSELEDDAFMKGSSTGTSSTGSLSDELTDSDIERNRVQARRAARTVEHRMKYFRKHITVLKIEHGKIIDPLRQMVNEPSASTEKASQSGSRGSFSFVATKKMSTSSRKSVGGRSITGVGGPNQFQRSISMENLSGALDALYRKKGTEETDRKRNLFHKIKMKKSLMLDRLNEYLAMLQRRQQIRLMEEHTSTLKKFKYAGPTRDGPLFCLREMYRRERKAWRVKYAKKYGLLCSRVRLEKRLMRKAKRLLTRERVLNALKDKSKSRLIVLLEMKNEYRKLVERLKLNKEIQEKIKRQDKLAKISESLKKKAKNKAGKAPPKEAQVKAVKETKKDDKDQIKDTGNSQIIKQEKPTVGKAESESQKSANVRIMTSEVSNISVLSRLPSVPETTQTSVVKLPPIKKPASKPQSKVLSSCQTSKTDTRCPPLVHDKKLGGLRGSISGIRGLPKAKEAKSKDRMLPLINEQKLGAAHNVKDDSDTSSIWSERIREYQQDLKNKELRIGSLLPPSVRSVFEVGKALGIEPSMSLLPVPSHHDHTADKRRSTTVEPKGKLVTRVEAPDWPHSTIIPIPELPGGYVRQSGIDPVPRYKFKKGRDKEPNDRDMLERHGLDLFAVQYRRAINDQLTHVFGSSRPDSFMNKVLMDVKKMSDFILDHLHLLPLRDLDFILGKLMDLKDDPRFESFKTSLVNVQDDLQFEQNDPYKRYEVKERATNLVRYADKGYGDFKGLTVQRRKEFRAQKVHMLKKGMHHPAPTERELKQIRDKKKRMRTMADKLLLQRTSQFNNPVRVTTKLGGRLMLQGWKPLTYDEYVSLGQKVPIYKTGWRKDNMENYEVIAPFQTVDDLKYLLILNRLDLTPRRFRFPGYKFDSHILNKYMYTSTFYRLHLLKRGERKTEKGKMRLSFQTETMGGHKIQRAIVGDELNAGEFTVPHLRHRIFQTPGHLIHESKPSDKHTPMVFSLRDEIEEYDEEDPRILKIRLQETPTIDLFEYKSTVSVRGTEEAKKYSKARRRKEKYDKMYHRQYDRETQTALVNLIDRSTQMYAPDRDSKRTNVHEIDILKASVPPPPPKVKRIRKPGFQEDDLSDSSDSGSVSSVESMPDETTRILTSDDFAQSVKLTLRIMDSQIYAKKQLKFRQGLQMNPLDPKAEIAYSHERLFSFIDHRLALSEYVVTSMDWSPVNPNLLAVAYSRHPLYPEQDKGLICIWNIKMVTRYEQKFEFKNGVTYLQFCLPFPRLLNVALLDGSVVILDLGAKRNKIVTAKLSSVFSDYKPVWQFSWFDMGKGNYLPITCGDNGFIHQLRPDGTFQHSKFLSLGHREGKVKGIKMSSSMGLKPRIRARPGITCMEKHPTDPVTYLVGTTDGCVHICSIHFRNQHLDVFSAHIGAVKGIQFHPHCEQVFLTYGEDFYVRVWLYGTFEPALELMAGNYYVRAATWSPANAEILVSISNKFVDVWDVRRKTDAPIHKFANPRDVENTALVFDSSGKNIVVGTISGDVYVYALKNMPFTHHFKGEAIASSMEKVLKAKKRFVKDIRKLGYPFGVTKDPSL